MTEDRIVLEPERRRMTGISASTAYRLERRGQFPNRVVLVTNVQGKPERVGWKLSELQAWIASREVLTLKPEPDRGASAAP